MKSIRIILYVSVLLTVLSCQKAAFDSKSDVEIRINPSLSEDTKASLVSQDNLNSKRIHLDGFISGSNTKHLDANLLYEVGAWKFYTTIKDVHYYWPQSSKLDFLAYCPSDLSKTGISVNHTTITCDLPNSDANQKADNFEEFVCAYKSACSKTDSPVSMELKRPFAVVNFQLDEAVRSDLNYIKITGIYFTGTLDVSSDTWTWTPTGTKGDFTCNVNKNYPTEINNGSHLGGPFIVMPQSLPTSGDNAVMMEFNYKTVGNDISTSTFVALGTSAIEKTQTQVSEWEPGGYYTYKITLKGAAGEVKMSVVCEPWTICGNSENILQ